MPPLEGTKEDFLTGLSHYPLEPTASTRKSSEVVRTMELSALNDVIFPFPEYKKAALALATIMREAYVARNPMTVLDQQRRHILATQSSEELPLPADWKSSGKGHFVMAISGMGKTTFVKRFLLKYPQVISHKGYNGQHLICHQIVYIVIRVPHDGTLKSLCLQFFEQIDKLLGTKYLAQAIRIWNIAPMVQLMNQVASAVSLGTLVVDELQNLKNAKGSDAAIVLNLFSEIIERLGISMVTIATPAVQVVFEGSVSSSRKMASYGETVLKPMSEDDKCWDEFCETYWDYCFVKNKKPLTPGIKRAWHQASAGNTAFAALAFALAQRNEIGGREIIDQAAFERTSATDMAFLQPAISALLSGDPIKLRAFDDLLFSPKYRALRAALGAFEPEPQLTQHDEFDEVTSRTERKSAKKRTKKKVTVDTFDGFGPMEDPLAQS